jgi:proteasome lid subunit RPN8/RPN11
MDPGIEFGDLEQARPGRRRRPDRDRHFAVCACGQPADGDLPIFIDLDTMAEIEAHAQSDTGVELGGVLLGGQFDDEEGRAFVLVLDSVRAEHYESSGSHFKFTHDTWTEITRRREEFSDDLQMVGWYHTHPDLGVFLSGMDRFICEHFFDRPLDVALVVDPVGSDRGWFYWGPGTRGQLPRAGGFRVITSRFRQWELEHYVALLEGETIMTTQRSSGAFPPGADLRLPQQVIHTIRPQLGWIGAAVTALLVLQLCTMLLVVLRLGPTAAGQTPAAAGAAAPGEEPAAGLAQREQILAARQQVFQDLLGHVKIEPDGSIDLGSLAEEYGQLRQQADQWRKTQSLLDESARWIDEDRKALRAEAVKLAASKQELAARNEELLGKIENLQGKLKAEKKLAQDEIAQLKGRLAEPAGDDGNQGAAWTWTWIHTVAALIGGLIVVALAAAVVVRSHRRRVSQPP